jgi:hypothetical protein
MRIEYSTGSNIIDKKINGLELELVCADKAELNEVISRLNKNKRRVHDISVKKTIDILDKCAKLWLNDVYISQHLDILSRIVNQSPELVKRELQGSFSMLLRENVEKMIKEELCFPEILDSWVKTGYGYVKRQPRGTVFHNISGNAFIVIPVSLSMGLLTKNCNLVKVSGDEPYFAYAFYKSLCEIDITIADRLSVVYFDSSQPDIYETVIKGCNNVIHWGGEESGKSIAGICAKYGVDLISHGAKISFEVIDQTEDIRKTAQDVATDIVMWEQKACLSPRIVFVNRNSDVMEFSQSLAGALNNLASVFPKAYLAPWNSIKTIQDRQYCALKYGLKNKVEMFSSFNADYTVILNNGMPDKEDMDKCFYRFVFVCPYENLTEVYNYVESNIREYLQTMGYCGNNEGFIEDMARLGVSIITRPGEMSMHRPGTSHDGIFNLQEMTYTVSRQL